MSLDVPRSPPQSPKSGKSAHFEEEEESSTSAADSLPAPDSQHQHGGGRRAQAPPRLRTDSEAIPPALRHARTTFRSPRRSVTSQQYNPNNSRGRLWKAGREPGIDPKAPHLGTLPQLQVDCDITLCEFAPEPGAEPRIFFYDNRSLDDLMHDLAMADARSGTRPGSSSCRWINVNGLSWDVISRLAIAKKFHKLAIEDVLSRKNRTKADWYTDHAYIVLPLQKLVHLNKEEQHESNGEMKGGVLDCLRSMFHKGGDSDAKSIAEQAQEAEHQIESYGASSMLAELKRQETTRFKTLQRYNGGVNEERVQFMEEHSALAAKNLAVSIEQVSIFLMADNTIVSFFEHSAQDIEEPILGRLRLEDTVLRRSCDASMMVQAILDGIVDLALPVATAYHDAIDELELNVLTAPQVHHTRSLYILQSEVSQLRSTIAPIMGLIDALRDHSSSTAPPPPPPPAFLSSDAGRTYSGPRSIVGSAQSVAISPAAKTYLADVADHVSVVTDNFEQMRRAADNMTDLIFNTVSAIQNESMRQLTVVTILFLPLTFITGYFGQNFMYFDGVMKHSDVYFWEIAIPVCFVIFVWVMRDVLYRWFVSRKQRLSILTSRRRRREMENQKMR